MDANLATIFLLAFSTGLLHALDADHVMAVTGIASRKFEFKEVIRLCTRWSIGHGLTLLILGAGVYALGLGIPPALSQYAETLVAIILIIIGLAIFYDLRKKNVHLHFHRHDGLQQHAHWHTHEKGADKNQHKESNHSHNHSAIFIGIIHGVAGIAPLLAVIPLASQPAWVAISYLAVFCIGVLLSMILFGGLLAKGVGVIQKYGSSSINVIRSIVAVASISLGIAWL